MELSTAEDGLAVLSDERLVRAALRQARWTEDELERRPKGEPRKREIACQLGSKTTMPPPWIVQRLCMGTRGHLAWLLQQKPAAPTPQALLKL